MTNPNDCIHGRPFQRCPECSRPSFEAPTLFDGPTYESDFDADRLGTQARKVWDLMIDGTWRTLFEIGDAIGVRSEASISARLRDFRKEAFGKHTVERRRRGEATEGVFEYRLTPNQGVHNG